MGEISAWELFGLLVGLISASALTNWTIVALMSNKLTAAITGQMKSLELQLADQRLRVEQVDRDIMTLKADLPDKYLRREDHIRYSAIIEAKLDRQTAELVGLSQHLQVHINREANYAAQ